jgi:hypothetical protein
MIVVMKSDTPAEEYERSIQKISRWRITPEKSVDQHKVVLGLIIEVHPNPSKALSDNSQSLTPHRYKELMQEMAAIGKAVGRWPEIPTSTACPKDFYLQKLALHSCVKEYSGSLNRNPALL